MEPAVLDELRRILTAHARHYPLMGPCDGVKLIYQNEFGGGHLIRSPAESLAHLERECAGVEARPDSPPFEEIGGGMVRVMLPALVRSGYTPETLNRDFVRSARRHTGTQSGLIKKLEVLRQLAGEGLFGFSVQALEDYLTPYLCAGCPAVSHSPEYRRAYAPAYRVVERSCSLPLLLEEVSSLCVSSAGRPVLVALDGRCASGKTTLAQRLQAEYGFAVVHMDHFFLRPEQRTGARYDQPGGNVDYERVLEQALLPLSRGEEAVYRPFDCAAQALGPPLRISPAPAVLVEGSYACHPALWDCYALHAFLTVPPQLQWERILSRNGPEYSQVFRSKWIPLEERYFSAFHIQDRCAYRLEGN